MESASASRNTETVGYELDDQTLSPIDPVALISMRPPKIFQKSLVLNPCWTLERNSPELDVPHSARFNSGDLAFQEIITSRPYRDSDRPIAPLLLVSGQPAVCLH